MTASGLGEGRVWDMVVDGFVNRERQVSGVMPVKRFSVVACGYLVLLLAGCGKAPTPTESAQITPPVKEPEPNSAPVVPKVDPPTPTPLLKKPEDKKLEEKKPREVTPEEVNAAVKAWEKIGAKYNPPSEQNPLPTFKMPDGMTDADMKKLPDMPVPFGLEMIESSVRHGAKKN